MYVFISDNIKINPSILGVTKMLTLEQKTAKQLKCLCLCLCLQWWWWQVVLLSYWKQMRKEQRQTQYINYAFFQSEGQMTSMFTIWMKISQ